MAALERETEISEPHAAWRAGLPILTNDRVMLRELRMSDAASLYRVARCPDVARYTWPAPPAVDAFELQAVDYVTVFAEPTPIELIRAVRPDVLVKGADYRKDEVVGAAFVESYGDRVHLAELRDGFSTTGMLQRFQAA